jgi:hypothetical protein
MTTPARGAPLRSAGGFAPRPSLSSYTTPGDTTNADHPTAFRLSNAMQANFHRASELYFEPIADRGAPKERGPG